MQFGRAFLYDFIKLKINLAKFEKKIIITVYYVALFVIE